MTLLLLAVLSAAIPLADPANPTAGVGLDEKPGARVPRDIVLRDADDRPFMLGDFIAADKTPIVLTLAYYRCPMLCGLVLNGLARTVRGLVEKKLGVDYRAITVSIDPRDGWSEAARTRDRVLGLAGRPDAGKVWRFTTGAPEETKRLADSVGFHYAWDERSEQFAHPAAVILLTPDGRVARYLYGFDLPPRQLQLALADAAAGRSRGFIDRVLLTCFHWDPATRRYGVYVLGFLRAGAVMVLVALGGLLFFLWRLERRRRGN